MGRTVEGVTLRSLAELGVALALNGAFLLDIDGDGDDFITTSPLVWMPGGAGRLTFVAVPLACWPLVPTGAMIPRDEGGPLFNSPRDPLSKLLPKNLYRKHGY